MQRPAYQLGKQRALQKLGMLTSGLGGAALGGLAGYALSPQDREGTGTLYGTGLGALGAVLGAKAAPFLHNKSSAKSRLARAAMPVAGAGLGALGSIGATQALIDKEKPDTSEDPYRYHVR